MSDVDLVDQDESTGEVGQVNISNQQVTYPLIRMPQHDDIARFGPHNPIPQTRVSSTALVFQSIKDALDDAHLN
jgi:hypothetical protein